jgi:hypothetical protein
VEVDAIKAKVKQEFTAKDKENAAKNGRAEAAGKGHQETKSGVTGVNILAEPTSQAPPFFCSLPVCPPLHEAPAFQQKRRPHPTRRA